MLLKTVQPWLLAALSGILGFLGYIGYDLFYLEWIFLIPLFRAIRVQSPGRSFYLGWLAGTIAYGGGTYWFVHLLTAFSGMNFFFGLIGLILFAAYYGLLFALFAWAVSFMRQRKGWGFWWTAPLIWTALENLYPLVFPVYIGASQYSLIPLTQIADITGILGISFLLISCNATLYHLLESLADRKKIPFREMAVFGIMIAVAAGYGFFRIRQIDRETASAPRKKVVMVQAGLGEAMKYKDPWVFFRLHREMSLEPAAQKASQDADLMIWPESVIAVPISRSLQKLPGELFGDIDIPILFGTITAERTAGGVRKYTSAMLIDEDDHVLGVYDKRILVPFGEYVPLGNLFPALYKWSPYISRFVPGTRKTPFSFQGYRFSVNICYEDLFGGVVRENMCADIASGNPLPHMIVNLTNDSWYGDTIEPMEHLVHASFRAIEHRRPLVRSTNTGISAIVDPVGRIQKRTGQRTREILAGEVPMMTGRTIYSYVGNAFGILVSCISVILLGYSFFYKSQNSDMKKTVFFH
ncbi:MAG: apolipoprotein N-acyltransferase [Desulfobacteraceae bacterium]|nr:MAG: apolipoprotein N-acyltransferase [Desulfobacteraceae bacterium]